MMFNFFLLKPQYSFIDEVTKKINDTVELKLIETSTFK